MLKLCVYVPVTHVEQVKAALFAAGAGRQGDYACCCWQSLGQGQFKPLAGSRPFIGKQDCLEVVDEYKVEMLCEEALKQEVTAALRSTHPYQTPAFDFVQLLD